MVAPDNTQANEDAMSILDVVHCRECINYKQWKKHPGELYQDEEPWYCSYGGRPNLNFPIGPDGFCSLGERKAD